MFFNLGSKILFYFYIKYWIHTPLAFLLVNERKSWKEHWCLAIYRLEKNYYFLFAKIYMFKMLFLQEFANFIQSKTLSFLITNMVFLMNMRKLWHFLSRWKFAIFTEKFPHVCCDTSYSAWKTYESTKTETNKICFEINRLNTCFFFRFQNIK